MTSLGKLFSNKTKLINKKRNRSVGNGNTHDEVNHVNYTLKLSKDCATNYRGSWENYL